MPPVTKDPRGDKVEFAVSVRAAVLRMSVAASTCTC